MKCPTCGRVLLETNNEGVKKLRSRMLLFEADGTKAICPSCKTKVCVPVTLDTNSTAPIKHVIIQD